MSLRVRISCCALKCKQAPAENDYNELKLFLQTLSAKNKAGDSGSKREVNSLAAGLRYIRTSISA